MADVIPVDDSELTVRGVEALNDALGPTGALRFLAMWRSSSTDYVEISRRMYRGQDLDTIFTRAAENWTETVREANGQ